MQRAHGGWRRSRAASEFEPSQRTRRVNVRRIHPSTSRALPFSVRGTPPVRLSASLYFCGARVAHSAPTVLGHDVGELRPEPKFALGSARMEGGSGRRSGGYDERAGIRLENAGLQVRARCGRGIDLPMGLCQLTRRTRRARGGRRSGLGNSLQRDHEKSHRVRSSPAANTTAPGNRSP